MKHLSVAIIILVMLGSFKLVRAESPHVDIIPPAGLIRADETIAVNLQVDSGGWQMNTAEISVRFPADRLQVDRIGREQSVLTIWPEEPAWDNVTGQLHLVGGRPGGLVAAPGIVATVYFRARQPGLAVLTVDPQASGIYLNDGQGSKMAVLAVSVQLSVADPLVVGIPLTSTTNLTPETWSRGGTIDVAWPVVTRSQYSLRLSADPRAVPDDTIAAELGHFRRDRLADGVYYFTIKRRGQDGQWSEVTQRRFLLDATPPEPFALQRPDPSRLGGANIISWSANDVTSGLARAVFHLAGVRDRAVNSPLRIDPQWRGRNVTVTVFDAAGNSRGAALNIPGAASWWGLISALAGLVIAVAVAAVFRSRRR